MQRRTFLASTCVLLTPFHAGCLSSIREFRTSSVQLGWFGVHNADPESAHTFALEVKRDGEVVHESVHEVDAAEEFENSGLHSDGAVAACDWGQTAGDYIVRVCVDGEESVEESALEFARENGADCVIADAEYRNHDAVSKFMEGTTLGIFLREGCNNDRYTDKCSFTQK